MYSTSFTVTTTQRLELVNITHEIASVVRSSGIRTGICYLFNPHTTSGLTINEGADPDVQEDIINGLQNMVPSTLPYQHREGNSPAHIMASLLGSSLAVFIEENQLLLGTWQKIFLGEFDGPRCRKIHLRLVTE